VTKSAGPPSSRSPHSSKASSLPQQSPPHPGSHSHAHSDSHSHSHAHPESDHAHPHPDHSHSHHPHSEHRHSHAEGHSHSHSEGHSHGHGTVREALARHAGQGKLLFLDAQSGIAGDMTIAALVDLGVPFSVVEGAVAKLKLSGYRLELRAAYAGAVGAAQFDVIIEQGQGERTYREIDDLIASSELDEPTRALSRQILRRLAEAESDVHRIPIDSVHFHEVGALDAIVDIVGAAACFCYLDARVVASPLPMGRGFVRRRQRSCA